MAKPGEEWARRILEKELKLAQEGSTNGCRFSESAIPFVQRLIAENHELFDALAQR